MMTADALARALGCTLSDLEDLDGTGRDLTPDMVISDALAGVLSARWWGNQK